LLGGDKRVDPGGQVSATFLFSLARVLITIVYTIDAY